LEGLLECVSSSGRFRTVSSSSVTFAGPSLSSCDIFPEIAGVVSASDSETDVGEYLVHGQDYLHAGDFAFSPPQPKLLSNCKKESEDYGDASVMEMLDTLCYSTHNLTHVNDVVQNVVLDWQSGAAFVTSSSADEVVLKTELSCENIELTCDDSLTNGYTATLPDSNHEDGDVLECLFKCASVSGDFPIPTASLSPVSGNVHY